MIFIAAENKYRVDLHGLTREQANIEMLNILDTLPLKYEAIHVIHGYSGVTLLKYIREELKHPRILKMDTKYNPGTTLIILDKNFQIDLKKKKLKKYKKNKKNNKKKKNKDIKKNASIST